MNQKFVKTIIYSLIALIVLLLISLLGISVGAENIPLLTVIKTLFNIENSQLYEDIIINLRLPRVILGFAVGGALSISGLLLQGIFRNPLVEPFTIGISGGASVGISLLTLLNLENIIGFLSLPVSGFLGAILIILLVYKLGIKNNTFRITNILLIGVMISFISSSLVMFIMAISKSKDINTILFWLMGSLEESNLKLILITLFISIFGLIIAFVLSRKLNLFSLGEEEAKSLGLNVERIKRLVYLTASVLTGFCVAVSGVISFVGLIIPHFMRILLGKDNRLLVITSYLIGGAFLILSDTLARTVIAPLQLPVGVITGLIGGISFIYLLNRKNVNIFG